MFPIIATIAIGVCIVGMALHYFAVGPRHPELAGEAADIRRFSPFEQILRLAVGLSFAVLAITGFGPAVIHHGKLDGYLLMLHCTAAGLFAVSLSVMAVVRADECRLGKHDVAWLKQWIRKCGGFCGKLEDMPAGRLDTAEKLTFWSSTALGVVVILSSILNMYPIFSQYGMDVLFQIHRYSTLILLIRMLKSVYWALLFKPVSWAALLAGRVSAGWAQRHHSLWWEQLESEKKQAETSE